MSTTHPNFTLPAGLIIVDATRTIVRCDDCGRQMFADAFGEGGWQGRIIHGRKCGNKDLQPLRLDAETGAAVPKCTWAKLPSGQWGLLGRGLVPGQRAVAVSARTGRKEVVVGVVVEEKDGVVLAARATKEEIPALQAMVRGEIPASTVPTGTVEECSECGAQYESYGNLGPGGMSCRRC